MMPYTIRPRDAATWDAFADLVERNNGIFEGCWCMGFHPDVSRTDAAQNRAGKQARVREGPRACARLAYRTGECPNVGSGQTFGMINPVSPFPQSADFYPMRTIVLLEFRLPLLLAGGIGYR